MQFIKIGFSVALVLGLSACVSTPSGKKQLAPVTAAKHADTQIGDWLNSMGYPTDDPSASQ